MSAITSRFSPASSSGMFSPGCATTALRKLRTRVSASTGSRQALTRKQPSKAGVVQGRSQKEGLNVVPAMRLFLQQKPIVLICVLRVKKARLRKIKKTDRFKIPCLLSKAAPGQAKPVAGGAPATSSLTKKGPALHAPGPLKSKKSGEA